MKLEKMGWLLSRPIVAMSTNYKLDDDRDEGKKTKDWLVKQMKDLGMYEVDMTEEQMEEQLKVVEESKNSANNHVLKTTSEFNSKLERRLASSSPQFDNRDSISSVSATTSEKESANVNLQLESSSEWPSIENKNLNDESCNHSAAQTKKSREKTSRVISNIIRDTNVNSSESISGMRKRPTKLTNYDIVNCKLLPNDVPLTPRHPPKLRQKILMKDGIPIISDEILARKNAYLTEMANLAHNWKSKLVCNEFSWGPPIKVGIANGSLDKFLIQTEVPGDPEDSELPKHQLYNTKTSYALRNRTRTTYATADSDIDDDDDDDDDDIVETSKSKKLPIVLANLSETKNKSQLSGQSEEGSKFCEMIGDDSENMKKIHNNYLEARPNTSEYPTKSDSQNTTQSTTSNSSLTKSKRKSSFSNERPKKRYATSVNENNRNALSQTPSLTETEIQQELMNDEPEILEHTVQPMKRFYQSVEILKKAEAIAELKRQKRKEHAKALAEQEAAEKNREARKRIKEREEKEQQREAQIQLKKQHEERYRNIMNIKKCHRPDTGTFQKRTELESENPHPRTVIFSSTIENPPTSDFEEINIFSNEDNKPMNDVQAIETSECPICGKFFSPNEIENHAGSCEDFIEDEIVENNINSVASTSDVTSPSTTFICKICNYQTQNENNYSKHVKNCIDSLTEEHYSETSSNHFKSKIQTQNIDSDFETSEEDKIKSPRNKKRSRKTLNRRKK